MKYYYPIVTWGVLIVLLVYQVIAPPSIVSAKDDLLKGSIAGINVEDKKKSEIEALLVSKVTSWKQSDVVVQGTTAKIVIPSSYFQFDIKHTANQYISESSKPWYNFLGGDKKVQLPLQVSIDEKIYEVLKEAPLFFVDETIEAIRNHASYLQSGPVEAQEVELTKDLLSRISFETQEVVVSGDNLLPIIHAINDTTLLNGETFSFLEKLTEVNRLDNEETANFVASTLYSVVLKSEMAIQERHSQHQLPDYLVPGIEVKVDAKRNQDFAFINNTNRPVMIEASINEERLVIELYSFESEEKVLYDASKLEVVQPRTVYRLTSTLAAGQEKVVEEGKNGLRVQVERQLPDGEIEVVSRDFYPPTDKVILVSTLTPPVSMVMPGELMPVEPESHDGMATQSGGQTISNDTIPIKEGSAAEDEIIFTDENGKPIPEGATYDKGGNLISSDPQ